MKDLVCSICETFSEQQRSMLSVPQYKIRKDKKSGLLVSPSKVTVVGVANQEDMGGEQDEEELDGVPVLASGSGEPQFSISHHTPEDLVSKRDFDTLSNQLEEKFARFEALLTRTNIFSTPKAPVSAVSITTSEQPFFNPSEPGATGLVRPPATDGQNPQVKDKKNKGTGKKVKKTKVAPTATVVSEAPAPVKDQTVSESLPAQRHEEPVKVDAPVPGPAPSIIPGAKSTSKPETSFFSSLPHTTTGVSGTSQSFSAEQDVSDVDSNLDRSDKASDEGEISDLEATEQNEEMNYRETCRSVRAFLGWNHIPDFELSVSDGDRSDNPWKGKHPRKTGKVSVELPPDDWLCHKMEKLNCRVAEGYPSRSQESAGLKVDQFIRTPKSQAKWYKQHRLRQDSTTRPGRTIFSWSDSEARLNAQYSRVAKVSSYPQSGPPSRPVPQDILRRWEKCAREGTYITNHAAAFNRCTSEIQDKMNTHIGLLNDVIVKGKAPKEVVEAIRDLKIYPLFMQAYQWL